MRDSVALLLDADNLSSASDVDEVFAHFQNLGAAVSLRRAYGGHDKLAGMKNALTRHAVRAFVNQGKGTTDVTLVIDAMDLLHHAGLPGTIAIGSSDADFAPLAVRLREAGMHVLCFARREKADADALALAYDQVVYLDAAQLRASEAPAKVARKTVARKEAVAPVAATAKPATTVTGKVASSSKSPALKSPAVKPGRTLSAEAILNSIPALCSRSLLPLNDVIKQLRDASLLAKHGKSIAVLRQLPEHFRLTPEAKPLHIEWIGR